VSQQLVRLATLVRAWLDGSRSGVLPAELTPELEALADEHRIGPILYDLAARSVDGDAVAARLRPSFYRTWMRNQALLEVATEVTSALVALGVAVVRLKGVDLLTWAYPNPGLRPMDDIDVLVPRARVPQAIAGLMARGFRASASGFDLDYYLEHHFHVALIEPRRGAYVEVHWQLLDRYRRGGLDADAVWATARPVDRDRPHLGLRLGPELLWLHLALHLDKHGPFHDVVLRHAGAAAAIGNSSSEGRLLWLVDLALVARTTPLDVDRLATVARRAGVERGLHTSLCLLSDLLGPERAPSGLTQRVHPPADGWLARRTERVVARLLASERPAARRLLAWAGRMDPAMQVRPVRLLELPLTLLRGGAASGPGGRLGDIGRAARMMSAALRRRGARTPGE